MIEMIDVKCQDNMPSMVPVLQALYRDSAPAVVRRAVMTGSILFRSTFEQVAMQGIYSGQLETSLQNAWICSVGLKDAMYATSKEHGNDGVRILTIKFLETAILLFTPDPNKPGLPPSQQNWDGHDFNIAWIAGGHPILDAEQLGQEADKYLMYLLEQLSEQAFCKLSGPVAIVIVNSLASIAKRRPALYGLIIPAFSRLSSICEGMEGPQRASIIHAVKNGLVSLLRCTHAGAGIWRERLTSALKAMNAGDLAEAAIRQTDRMLRNADRERAFRDSHPSKEESMQPVDYKRPLLDNGSITSDSNVSPAKRLQASHASFSDSEVIKDGQNSMPLQESMDLTIDSRLTPLQQMIVMIGALVSKGERAVAAIEILIPSLPADVLADIVIENMKNLPPTAPAVPSGTNTSGTTSDPQTNLAGSEKVIATMSASAGVPASSPSTQAGPEHRRDPRRDPRRIAAPASFSQPPVVLVKSDDAAAADSQHSVSTHDATSDPNTPTSPFSQQEPKVESYGALTSPQSICGTPRKIDVTYCQEKRNCSDVESVVEPNSNVVLQPESATAPAPAPPPPAPAPAPATLVSELSSIPAPMDVCDQISEVEPMDTAEAAPVSTVVPSPSELDCDAKVLSEGTLALPVTMMPGTPLSVPSPSLDKDQQVTLWKGLLLRILETYTVSGSGGRSGLRFGLLSRLISQDVEDDADAAAAVTILRSFILEDYQNHKGHELAIHTLYQFCTEKISVESNEFGNEIYEKFLISMAQGLRETLPPADKSLSRLLSEAPIVPNGVLKWLETICNPSKDDPINGERIFQGLSAVWILILLRPPIRGYCLEIALKCAVHHLDEVRTKAIRLVANKLYPLPYASQRIEDFTVSMLYNVVGRDKREDKANSLVCHEAWPHKQDMEQVLDNGDDCLTRIVEKEGNNRNAVEGDQYRHVSLGEAQRCMSLYFALCTKKVPLLQQLFDLYENAPKAVRQVAHRNMPVLIRTIGSTSSDLLLLLSDPPLGSKNLLLLVLHLLTDADAPSVELIAIVKKLYDSKIKDARLLIPVLSSLTKAEVLPIFPHLVALPSEDFKAALDRILQGSIHTGPALTPAEVLVAIHAIDPDRDRIPLAMVKEACAVCFEQRTVFTQQVLAKVLKQLVEQTPVPMLFMRTVILAVGSFRSLVGFVMEILSRLVIKQIWKWPNLWIGFLKCADQTQPHSFPVLLQLPAIQLDKALHKHPNLRMPLTAYANKPSVRSGLSKPILVVLGLLQDALSSEPVTYGQAVPSVASSNVIERQARESAATS